MNDKTSNLNDYFSEIKQISIQFIKVNINSHEDEVLRRYRSWFDHFTLLYGNMWNKITLKEITRELNHQIFVSTSDITPKYIFGSYTAIITVCKLYLLFKIKLYCEKNKVKESIAKIQKLNLNSKQALEQFETGQLFYDLFQIRNIPSDNLFNWYIYCWDELEESIKRISLIVLNIIALEVTEVTFFKDLYEKIIPQNIRRLLGEFYTPIWLIDFMLVKLNSFKNEKFLDPCCGTGGFLARMITFYSNSLKNYNKTTSFSSVANILLEHIYGFDINPVSIIMSKIVYILTLIENLHVESLIFQDPVDIPVFERNIFSYKPEINEFDVIIGNPPWIKFDTLTIDYRKTLIEEYLSDYQLFSFSGMKAGLGYAQDDLSAAFLIVTAEKFLKKNGILFFIMKQSLFKSEAGKNFRKFNIQKKNNASVSLKVEEIWDFRDVWPFKTGQKIVGAETALIKLVKGQKTHYPLPYWKFFLKNGNKVDPRSTLEDILELIEVKKLIAIPDPERTLEGEQAPWIISDRIKQAFPTYIDAQHYKARHGVVNDLISVFHVKINDTGLEINSSHKNDDIIIKPSNNGKMQIPKELDTNYVIEKHYLFPVIKSRYIKRWNLLGYDYMVIPYNIQLSDNFEKTFIMSKTYKYLETFQVQLRNRKSRWFRNKPFYSLFGIGPYTFSPYKIVWVCLGKTYKHRFVVVSNVLDRYLGNVKKILIPDNPVGFIPVYDEDTAYYLCGILNSQFAENYLQDRVSEGKWSLSIYHISNFPFRKFNSENELHMKIVEITKNLHILTKNDEKKIHIDEQEELLNEYVNKLYFKADK